MSSSFVGQGRAVALVCIFVLVGCNTTTSMENGDADEMGVSGSGSSAGSGGSTGGGSGSQGGTASGGAPSSAGAGAASGGTSSEGGNPGSAGSLSAGGAGGDDPGVMPNPDFIFNAHFTQATLGPYAREAVQADFGAEPPWDNGLAEGRAAVVEEEGNRFLRVTYSGNVYGPADGGVQFVVDLGGDYQELYFSYRVRFEDGFAFNMGGKLPGFGGGTNPTGCEPDEGGFSARNMWRGGGAVVQYVYWPDQPNTCGDDLYYQAQGSDVTFVPGSWQTIEHRVRMNTPGQNDGVLEGWVDGELSLSETDRQWRKTDAFAIDIVYFSTFFGGGSQPWASPKQQSADFDDLIVSMTPISH